MNIHEQKILILDFGSQYTQLIARRIREIGVYCEIHPYDMTPEEIERFNPDGIILSGGPESVMTDFAPSAPAMVFELRVPVLGICYGMQTLALQLGGKVETSSRREFGYAQLQIHGQSQLLKGIEDSVTTEGHALLEVWMSHGDRVIELPQGFTGIAYSSDCPFAAMADEERGLYGLQFHPEVTHTRQGKRLLERFVLEICGCLPLWTPGHFIEESIVAIRRQVGKEHVLLGLSGGVDSAVAAALLHRAIGEQLTCLFVDHGLLRYGEAAEVMQTFSKHFGIRIVHVDASEQFLTALAGVTDPEQKRKINGQVFIQVFEEYASQLSEIKWLAQGTIYPDVIESAGAKTGKAKKIKSHHNVGGLPDKMNLRLLEPLRELFKDEVRRMGLELGLPYDLVYRHPFPGPGLSVRILGEVKQEYIDIVRRADAIFIEELRQQDYYYKVNQAFAVFLPIKSVAVMGDARKYEYVIALRAVETTDFMTAHWAQLPHKLLAKISHRIINEVSGISRVVYDISGKPPATIEWE